MNNQVITEVESHKHLGVTFESSGTWHKHIKLITTKAWQQIRIMRKLKFRLDRKELETIYMAFIRPTLEYADVVWYNIPNRYEEVELEKIQLEAARIVTGTTKLVSTEKLYNEAGWETLSSRRRQHKLTMYYKMTNYITPAYLSALLHPLEGAMSRYPLRNSEQYQTSDAKSQLL